jgi:peptidoglycan L-alanyl-D-glutamate endopeptidase CwlK
MSATLFPDDTLFIQRMLKTEDLYQGRLDGIWGPLTERAADRFHRQSFEIAEEYGRFDPRTESSIATLTLQAQQQARLFMQRVLPEVPGVKIISGTRSYAEQNKLFRQGRYHNPGPIITHARGGRSAHNFGIAWDIGIFTESSGYLADGPLYDQAAQAGRSDTIEWGGDWTGFTDRAHYQLKLAAPIRLVREQFEAGKHYLQMA